MCHIALLRVANDTSSNKCSVLVNNITQCDVYVLHCKYVNFYI